MRAGSWPLGILVSLAVVAGAHAQTVDLTEAPLADKCFRIDLTFNLQGKITVQQKGEPISFPHEAEGRHVYVERVLEASGGIAQKTVRHYEKAEALITFNKQAGSKKALRPDRAFMATQRTRDELVVFSPRGSLTREEKELTEHFDSLAVSGLVPGKSVKVGDTWKLATPVALALCDLDGLTEHDITCKLDSVKDETAIVTLGGTATGISLGAQVKLLINARYEFDTRENRVVAVGWKQSDQRVQGPVSPAMSAEVVIKLKRTPIEEPAELGKFALVQVPAEPPAALLNLRHHDAKDRYDLRYARDWHIVSSEDSPQLVLRLIDRGDFIAQATVTPWKKGDPVSLEKFAELMKATPGWQEEQMLEKTQLKNAGHALYRVTASGSLDDVKTVQAFYLVAGPQGEQLIVSVSAVPSQVQKLGSRDQELVRSITFPK